MPSSRLVARIATTAHPASIDPQNTDEHAATPDSSVPVVPAIHPTDQAPAWQDEYGKADPSVPTSWPAAPAPAIRDGFFKC